MVDVPERPPVRADNPLVTAAVIVFSIIALYVGAGIFVPLVLAVLLAFALAPFVSRLRRLHVPHVAAVIIAVGIAAAILATIGYIVATQLVKLAADLPSYQATVATKLKGLQHSFGDAGFLDNLGSAVNQLKAQIAPTPSPGLSGAGSTPMPVTIANAPDNPLGMAQSILGSVLGPLATAAIVVVFLVFLLLERADLRDRFLKLVSRGDLRTSTKVMDDAAARVGRYLLVQFSVNLTYGIIFGIGLTVIGVPNGILWGLLATLFRYIPFVGTLIVATIPFTLAFAVDPGWAMLIKSVVLFVALEATTTNVVEPRLYGSSTGLSPLAVLVAAMFWATLWGPLGLILSTPLTVCLVVLGRYVPQLQFLEILLGSEPVLSPEEQFYQRLVAGNAAEAIELAERYDDTDDPCGFYQEVALPALQFAEADLSVDAADLVQRRRLVECLDEVIDELDVEIEPDEENARTMIVGGRTELDGAGARILASMMRRAGIPTRVLPPMAVRREALRQLDTANIDTICLVYLGERSRSYARFVSRQLRRQHPHLRLIVAMLGAAAPGVAGMEGGLGVDAVVTTAGDAVRSLSQAEAPASPAGQPNAPSEADAERSERLEHAIKTDPAIAELLKRIAEQLGASVAIASIANGIVASPDGATPSGQTPNGPRRLTDRVVETGEILVVSDASKDKEFAQDAFLLESGVRLYVGAPLFNTDGRVMGVLSIMDETARKLDPADIERVAGAASEFAALLHSQAAAGPLLARAPV